MSKIIVHKCEEKHLELLKNIDAGEFQFFRHGETYETFEKWLFRYGVEIDHNFGIMTACIFDHKIRIQISFNEDISDVGVFTAIFNILETVMVTSSCNQAEFWCNNFNHQLVAFIIEKYGCEARVAMTHEFKYDFNNFIIQNIEPLIAVAYHETYLDDVINLLEQAFVKIAGKGEFLSNKDFYHQVFMNQEKASCEVFLHNREVIGMYSQNDGNIEYIAVMPAYQNQSFGTKILHRALDAIRIKTDQIPYLYCVDENDKAIAFYLREGWTLTARSARLLVDVPR